MLDSKNININSKTNCKRDINKLEIKNINNSTFNTKKSKDKDINIINDNSNTNKYKINKSKVLNYCDNIDNRKQSYNLELNKLKISNSKEAYVRNNRIKKIINNDDNKNNKHKKLSNLVFYSIKTQFICFFCGGQTCKHEDYTKHKSNSYIKGLHSDLINDNIIASQRPSTILIKKYDLIKELKNKSIGLIINLQQEGEHPYCGPNKVLEDSGFSYNPHDFISEGIDVILGGWQDLSIPDSMLHILNLVKQMYTVIKINKMKVLIHCHAGYGRTGILIACYIFFTKKMNIELVIKDVRKIRSKCIQKKAQYNFCKLFALYVINGKQVFINNIDSTNTLFKKKKAVEYFILNQNNFILPSIVNLRDEKEYKHIPRIIIDVLDRIRHIFDYCVKENIKFVEINNYTKSKKNTLVNYNKSEVENCISSGRNILDTKQNTEYNQHFVNNIISDNNLCIIPNNTNIIENYYTKDKLSFKLSNAISNNINNNNTIKMSEKPLLTLKNNNNDIVNNNEGLNKKNNEKKNINCNNLKANLSAQICESFLGFNNNWDSKKEYLLELFKTSINNGQWDIIHYFSDIDVLSELLWDWIDDNVLKIVSESKLISVFSNEDIKTKIDNNNYNDINNNNNLSKDAEEILSILKLTLNHIEFNTLYFIADFIGYTINPYIEDESTLDLVYLKFCYLLLGYKLNSFYKENLNRIQQTDINYNNINSITLNNNVNINDMNICYVNKSSNIYNKNYNISINFNDLYNNINKENKVLYNKNIDIEYNSFRNSAKESNLINIQRLVKILKFLVKII